MQVIRLSRFADFIDCAEAQPGWAFRGEESAHWPLVSSLTRRLQTHCGDDRTLWPLREQRALRITRPSLVSMRNTSRSMLREMPRLSLSACSDNPSHLKAVARWASTST